MAKVVFIGAGSFGFTRGLVRDLLTFPLLRDAEIALVDIDQERLDFARQACERIVAAGEYPATITCTTDRREVLEGADAVMVTILCGDTSVWQHDILIPKKYGVDTNVGDTRGPSGIFRALRTIPTMLDIARDMQELCPNAIMLNYTNPMAMLCHAMQRETRVVSTGLCHSVQGTAAMLARWANIEPEQMDYVCAGINHMSWFLELKHQGQDLYPRIRQRVETDPEVYNHEQVRNELFLALDYYITESSGHNSEYNWWFRKREDLIEKYCTHGTGWNPGHYAYILDSYRSREDTWKQQVRDWLESKEPIALQRGHEYAAAIASAWIGGDPYRFNGNVPNDRLIDNLPDHCCVEVPVLATRNQLQPIRVGALPPQCAMLTGLSAQIEMLTVDGCLQGDARKVYQAVAHDPLTAAVLSLEEIKTMVTEMFQINREHLPTFSHIDL